MYQKLFVPTTLKYLSTGQRCRLRRYDSYYYSLLFWPLKNSDTKCCRDITVEKWNQLPKFYLTFFKMPINMSMVELVQTTRNDFAKIMYLVYTN